MIRSSLICMLFGLLLTVNNISASSIDVVNGKINITIGTTSMCGDTVWFISNVFAEAYAAYGEYLDVKFVPWGRTQRDPDDTLRCQFGEADCWANRVHRCSLYLLEGNQDAQVEYMTCEFSPPHPAALLGSYQCGQQLGLNIEQLDHCVYTSGWLLDLVAEEEAREPMTVINFVPSIHFNDVLDFDIHRQAFVNLVGMVCNALTDAGIIGKYLCPA